jgi:diadenosine tetraphosphate (Ap4A) HIT family hydrolase
MVCLMNQRVIRNYIMNEFVCDERLLAGSVHLGDFPLCRVLFKNHADYAWCVLVPRVNQIQEIYQLSKSQQNQLMQEISILSEIIKEIFQPDKLNVASLGNIVSQLHIHVVGRFCQDPLWPQGIWQNAQQAIEYSPSSLDEFTRQLKTSIQLAFSQS